MVKRVHVHPNLIYPVVETKTPLAEELLQMRSLFLSRLVYQTYNGYVMTLGSEQLGPMAQFLGTLHEFVAHCRQSVGRAKEDQRRRTVLGQLKCGRNRFANRLVIPDPFHQLENALETENRVEQNQGIGLRRDCAVFSFCIQAGRQSRAGGNVAARRSTGSHDSVGIDAELGGLGSNPPNGAFGIFDAFLRGDSVPGFHSVVSPYSHHATAGQVACLGFKLLDLAAGPTAAAAAHKKGIAWLRGRW